MTVSMDDVARHAGVSKSTVSLVLNERPGTSNEMRRRVLDAARETGYQLPEQRQRASESHQLTDAPVIALVHCVSEIPDFDEGLTYLYLAYRNGIQRYTHGRDISVMLVTSFRDNSADSLSYQLLTREERAFDGLILMGPGLKRNSKLIERALDQQIPTVILGRSWADVPISSVSQDHSAQAVLVMDHLLSLGHTKIGFVARTVDRDYDWFEWRLQAYRDAMASHFGTTDDALVSISTGVPSAVGQLLSAHPDVTAIYGMNDHIAYQAMRAVVDRGIEIPRQLSVIGTDGVFESQEGLTNLTTVTFPHEEVGFLAAEVLVNQFENSSIRSVRITVQSHLTTGASCASPRSGK